MQATPYRETVIAPPEELYSNDEDDYILKPQVELPEDAFPENNKVVLVPQLQSMRDYIVLHYKKPLSVALCRWISGDEPGAISLSAAPIAHPNTCNITNISFWREDTFILTARIRMSVEVVTSIRGIERAERRDYWADVLFDMKEGIAWKEASFQPYEGEAPDGWMLTDYLIPILRKDEIEEGAEALLRRFYPDALVEPEKKSAFVLAEQMGLQIMELPLHKRNRTRSILFFCEGEVSTKGKNEPEEIRPKVVRVPGNTIVLNTNAARREQCQMDVYHECIHYDWHFMFYCLQEMHSNDVHQLRKKKKVARSKTHRKNPLTWMEWQARRGGFALMMPLSVMKPLVQQKLDALWDVNLHMGEKLDDAARRIAREYNLPKYRVRARLIQMGYIAAKGALNYIDGRYIRPFMFSTDNGSGSYTFVINRKGAFDEYSRNDEFRERIDSGQYIYVDGHICLNDPQYVEYTSQGLRLTKWANAHVDECCLRFISVYEQNEAAEYRLGALNSDEEYNNHYLTFPDESQSLTRKEQMEAMSQILDNLPGTFHGTLVKLMEMRKISNEQMEERSRISARTISRLRTEERKVYSLDQVMAICVALHLPPWLSSKVLSRAGCQLRTTPLHRAYRFVLDCMFMDTIEEVQQLLISSKQPPLNLKAVE